MASLLELFLLAIPLVSGTGSNADFEDSPPDYAGIVADEVIIETAGTQNFISPDRPTGYKMMIMMLQYNTN